MDIINPFSHDPDELVRLAVTNVSQGHTLYELRRKLKQDFVSMYESRHEIHGNVLVERAFIILDWYFFRHALHRNGVQHSMRHHHAPSQLYKQGVLGSYHNKQIIVYSHLPCGKKACSRERLLSTLIHEMVHAYLHIFSNPQQFESKLGSNRAHGVPWNVLYHTMTNTISQWPCISGGFGGVADEQGCNSYVYSFETLEYPTEDDPASDNEQDKELQSALSDTAVERNDILTTGKSANQRHAAVVAATATALPTDQEEVKGSKSDGASWINWLGERLRSLVVMLMIDIALRMTNVYDQ